MSGARVHLRVGMVVDFNIGPAHPPRHGKIAVDVRPRDMRDALARTAHICEDRWADLARLADDEPWDVCGTSELGVLRAYIRHTFERADVHNLIVYSYDPAVTPPIAAFNTGLVTKFGQDIYGLFREIRDPRRDTAWTFTRWVSAADVRVVGVFDQRPARATYVTDPTELLFDPDLEIFVAVDHVLEDRRARFPAGVVDGVDGGATALRRAIGDAIGRLRAGDTGAAVQFHNGRLQHLLPLSMSDTGAVNLVLVVERCGGEYRAPTVLTVPMAYSNARLLGRQDIDWLRPDATSPHVCGASDAA